MLYAALLMTVSLIFFVLWETIKMVVITLTLRDLRDAVLNAPPNLFVARLVELKNAEGKLHVKLMYFWFFVLAVCVIFGLAAGGILINGFLRELIYS